MRSNAFSPLLALWIAGGCGGSSGGDNVPGIDSAGGPAQPDVIAVVVAGPGGAAPVKGDRLQVTIRVANPGGPGMVQLTPLISTQRFSGFDDVPLGTVEQELAGGVTSDVTLDAGPFVGGDGAWFALGRAEYAMERVRVELDGELRPDDDVFEGGAIAIGSSGALLQAVVYDAAYFAQINWTDTPEAYLRGASTRASELFTPDSAGSPDGTYASLPGGFDQLLGVEQHFLTIPGLVATEAAGGFCEQIAARARMSLGLSRDWDIDESQPSHTDAAHHGFDLLIGLTPEMGGGAACGWLGVQVSGRFGFDLSLDRSQIIVVHETGHLFGAPHCDPLQGYVMCAGERHPHYERNGTFVWHQASRDVMANRWQ